MRDVGDEDRADLVGDLARTPAKSMVRGIAVPPHHSSFGFSLLGELAHLVEVDAVVVLAHAVLRPRVKYLPVIDTFQPCVRWPPAGSAMPMMVSPGLQNAR